MNVQIIENYSERSFVVIGETYPIKDKLKQLGGSFNKGLKHNGKQVIGWVFSKKRLNEVSKLIANLVTVKIDKPEVKVALHNIYKQGANEHEQELINELNQLTYELQVLEAAKEDAQYSNPDIIICNNMPKILSISAIEETGTKVGCKKDINIGLLDNSRGVTVQNAAEIIYDNHFYNGEFGYDYQEIRNTIIDILLIGKQKFIDDIVNQSKIDQIKDKIERINILLTH